MSFSNIWILQKDLTHELPASKRQKWTLGTAGMLRYKQSAYEMRPTPRVVPRKETAFCAAWPTWLDSTSHSAFDSTKNWKMELQLSGIELCFNI